MKKLILLGIIVTLGGCADYKELKSHPSCSEDLRPPAGNNRLSDNLLPSG